MEEYICRECGKAYSESSAVCHEDYCSSTCELQHDINLAEYLQEDNRIYDRPKRER